jgi:hypothetical protein
MSKKIVVKKTEKKLMPKIKNSIKSFYAMCDMVTDNPVLVVDGFADVNKALLAVKSKLEPIMEKYKIEPYD